MDIPSYLLGKKARGGASDIPIIVIKDNSEDNPFILSEHEPGVYYFENMTLYGLGSYLVFCKVNENSMVSNFAISPNAPYFYYTNKVTDVPSSNAQSILIGYTGSTIYQSDGTPGIQTVNLLWTGGFNTDVIKGYGTDLDMVTKSTEQTITGKKTFSTLPESSVVPTTGNQLVNKKYVDDNAGGSSYTAGTNIAITEENVINNTIPYNIEQHTNSITLGSSMSINKISNSMSVFIGDYVSCDYPVNSNVLVGFQASVFSNQAVNCIAIGRSSGVFGADSVAFGFGARGSHNNSMAFGSHSKTTKENQVIFGSQYNPINEINIYTSNGSKKLATEDYVNSAIANAITSALGGNY